MKPHKKQSLSQWEHAGQRYAALLQKLGGGREIPWLITKGARVWHEGDGNGTNRLGSNLNLGLNSTHDELVREGAMPLRRRTDSVKTSLLIFMIIDLQTALLPRSLPL